MRVYLAGRFGDRFLLRQVRASLQAMGVEVTSRWLDEDGRPDDPQWDETGYAIRCATRDIIDICVGDALILYTQSIVDEGLANGGTANRGGLYHEFGYAHCLADQFGDMRLILVGPKTHVFTYLPEVEQLETWEELYGKIQQTTDALSA